MSESILDTSVLNTIKLMLGVEESFHAFDIDIIININSALFMLSQLGVCQPGIEIRDDTATWQSVVSNPSKLQLIKTYIYLSVRMLFDPPASATLANVFNEKIKECEWRLNVEVDPGMEVSYD